MWFSINQFGSEISKTILKTKTNQNNFKNFKFWLILNIFFHSFVVQFPIEIFLLYFLNNDFNDNTLTKSFCESSLYSFFTKICSYLILFISAITSETFLSFFYRVFIALYIILFYYSIIIILYKIRFYLILFNHLLWIYYFFFFIITIA